MLGGMMEEVMWHMWAIWFVLLLIVAVAALAKCLFNARGIGHDRD